MAKVEEMQFSPLYGKWKRRYGSLRYGSINCLTHLTMIVSLYPMCSSGTSERSRIAPCGFGTLDKQHERVQFQRAYD